MGRHGSRPIRAKKNYVYLKCRNSKRGDCSAAGMLYHRFEESFAGLFILNPESFFESLTISEPIKDSKSDSIRNKLFHVEKQIAKLKAAFKEMEDPAKAVSLGAMLTDYDTQRTQLIKDIEQAIIQEKGKTPLTKSHLELLVSLFGRKSKSEDHETRRMIQEALRVAIDRITIDVKTQSYKVTLKNSPNVFEVKLTKTSYEIKGVTSLLKAMARIPAIEFN